MDWQGPRCFNNLGEQICLILEVFFTDCGRVVCNSSGGVQTWRHMSMAFGVQILYGTVVYLDPNIIRDYSETLLSDEIFATCVKRA